ncbi:hypothetical protein EXU85_15080 [Spirosoma sp. KCTC 42546]|uniref:caspase family protein n=1 Tax=Spirosoma sp. KCTC 42546 TaxID=2520506 RepID=UPI001158008E|nr:caspase family protein [Spirosoma sp. KCTC 42546]QDK79862.1 hypothetical protein EXU85_15080 [Spirosoma sp. KCTC 42546]
MLEQEDRNLGLINLRNEELMNQITKTVEWGLGYPMKLTYLSKKDFTRAALNKTISSLKTGAKDIIILYYSGFGIMSPQNTGNFANWKLKDAAVEGLSVSEVQKWLLAKNVHLRLLIADCSAQFVIKDNIQSTIGLDKRDPRKQIIQQLFLNNCGLVKMGSSLPLVPSWMDDDGSVFTKSLNSAFQELLLTNKPAEMATVSFQRLITRTESYVHVGLAGKPFNQAPVLEIKSCRTTILPIVQRASIDPMSNETLNSLLNAMATNRDSIQRIPIREQLLGLSQVDAMVEVGRFFLPDDSFIWKEEERLHKKCTLNEYLDQLNKPLSYVENGKSIELIGILKTISITTKEVDPSVPKPIKSLTIREEYIR